MLLFIWISKFKITWNLNYHFNKNYLLHINLWQFLFRCHRLLPLSQQFCCQCVLCLHTFCYLKTSFYMRYFFIDNFTNMQLSAFTSFYLLFTHKYMLYLILQCDAFCCIVTRLVKIMCIKSRQIFKKYIKKFAIYSNNVNSKHLFPELCLYNFFSFI